MAVDILNTEFIPALSENNRDNDNKISDDQSLVEETQLVPTNTRSPHVLQPNIDYENPIPSTSGCITARELLPFPKRSIDKKKVPSRKQHATIITGTPVKEVLSHFTKKIHKENKRAAKENKVPRAKIKLKKRK